MTAANGYIFYYFVFRSKKRRHLGQGIQEWAKKNLWKIALKEFEVIWSRNETWKVYVLLQKKNFIMYCYAQKKSPGCNTG